MNAIRARSARAGYDSRAVALSIIGLEVRLVASRSLTAMGMDVARGSVTLGIGIMGIWKQPFRA